MPFPKSPTWRVTRPVLWIGVICLAVGACGRSAASGPDLLLVHGKVFTADAENPWAEAIAIDGERIVAVGDSDDLRPLATSHTRVLDLGGRTVVPGINDAHRHFGALPDGVHELELTALEPSWEETRGAIERAVADLDAGTPIHGTVGVTVVTDPSVDRRLLDTLAPDHPLSLAAFYGHGEIHNSRSLARHGVGDMAPDPAGGFYEREAGSHRINGRMFEYAHWNLTFAAADRLEDEEVVTTLRGLGDRMLRTGITSMQNMPLLPLTRYVRLLEQADLPIRVRAIRFPPTTSAGRDLVEGRDVAVPPRLADRVRISGTKWIVDGTPLERGAALRQPYSDAPGWSGRLNFSADEIAAMLRESVDAADPLLLHVVGDRALEVVLDAMQGMERVDWPARRLRIEHGDTLAGDLVERARRLGVVVVQNPTHFAMAQFMLPRFGEARVVGTLRTLLDAGIPVALGSDGPPNPWLDVMLATVHPTAPAEAITVEEAISAYTLGSAFAELEEEEKGSVSVGKLADLAVLSQDPFTAAVDAIPATISVLTLIGGRVVYQAPEFSGDG